MNTFIRKVYGFIQTQLTGADSSLLDDRLTVGLGTYGVVRDTVRFFRSDDQVNIGKYCSIASGVTILASGEHNYSAVANFPFAANILKDTDRDTFTKGKVDIGNDVWIGTNAIITSGVSIGNGAVVAAGAVVVKNAPPYSIVGGVPAQIIKYWFSEGIIDSLLRIKWWNWEPNRIEREIEGFYLSVEDFVSLNEGRKISPESSRA